MNVQNDPCNVSVDSNITDLLGNAFVRYQLNIDATVISLFRKIRTEAIAGVTFSVFGVCAAILYKTGNLKNIYLGATSFVSLFLAGLIYWTAVGRFITVIYEVYQLCNIKLWKLTQVSIPYALTVGFLVGILNLCAAFWMLMILFRNKNNKSNRAHWPPCDLYVEEHPP